MSINFNDPKYANVGCWQEVFEPSCTERIKKAKKRVLTDMEMCVERGLAYKKAMEAYPDAPGVIQRARMFEQYLKDKTVCIWEDELIVGNITGKPRGASFAPEMVSFVEKDLDDPVKDFEIRPASPIKVAPEARKILREELIPFFRGKSAADVVLATADAEVKKVFPETAADPHLAAYGNLSMCRDHGHQAINFEKALQKGLKGIREEALYYMNENEKPYLSRRKKEKRDFYEAVLISLDAAIAYSKRYAVLAREMAEKETDLKRKQELYRIAQNCDHVPENPPRDWWEACQAYWMIHLLTMCEVWYLGNTPGRFDQYMYPYYKKTVLEEKAMTRDEALELLEGIMVKHNEWCFILSYDTVKIQPGQALSQTFTIGGQKPDGSDACNEVTMLCLDAEEQVGLPQPDIAMTVWDGTPDEYLRRAAEVIRWGRGKPKFISERKMLQMLPKRFPDLPIEDMHNGAIDGCTELRLPGIEALHPYEGSSNFCKILELTLFNGKCILCDKLVGPETGDPRSFESISALKDAFKRQMDYWLLLMVKGVKLTMEARCANSQIPFCSSLYDGPLQQGLDYAEGGVWYGGMGVYLGGLADTADSFGVIDKLIYREKRITWDQLLAALKDNWEGHEELRQLCLNSVPKYGNDDDYADGWAIWLVDIFNDTIDALNNRRDLIPACLPNGRYVSAGVAALRHEHYGNTAAALPNGRRYPDPVADCNSPSQGADRNGPTAVIKSFAKLPAHRFTLGGLLNLRLQAQQLRTDEDMDRFVAFLRSVETLGIWHTQYNVISSELMREAMREPEKHRDLLVRVASFMAYFVELTPKQQIDIINRTEHERW